MGSRAVRADASEPRGACSDMGSKPGVRRILRQETCSRRQCIRRWIPNKEGVISYWVTIAPVRLAAHDQIGMMKVFFSCLSPEVDPLSDSRADFRSRDRSCPMPPWAEERIFRSFDCLPSIRGRFNGIVA